MNVTDKDLAEDQRWHLVTRVVESPHFERAVQLRELLLYLAKRAIVAPSGGVSEQEIGSNVLGRRPDYDPQADNIVRVQIRHLRQKLDKYFLTDGMHEPVLLSIPKGSHVLRFEPRIIQSAAIEQPPTILPAPKVRWWRQLIWAAGLAAIAFLIGRSSTDRIGAATVEQNAMPTNPLWSRVFVKDQPTTIVIADSSMVIVQNVLGKSFTLSDYIDRSFRNGIESEPNTVLRDALRIISNRQYTSLADATLSGELRVHGTRMGARVAVQYARYMQVRDFNSGNFILIGSRHSVPWVELFEPGLNFHFEKIGGQGFGFRNQRPTSGEAPVYSGIAPSTGQQESFATISMLPNLSRNGNVLMLAGVTMEATEAAGGFSMTNNFAEVLRKSLGWSSKQSVPFFEILLKTASTAGAPHKVEVIAWRKPAV